MRFDPTISLGTLVAIASIVLAIAASTMGVLRQMTEQQQVIKALIERVNKVERNQERQSDTLAELATLLSGTAKQLELVCSIVLKGQKS